MPFTALYCSHNDRTISAKAGLIHRHLKKKKKKSFMIYLILDPQKDPSQNQIYLSFGKCLFSLLSYL